jgi:hypothetical protein
VGRKWTKISDVISFGRPKMVEECRGSEVESHRLDLTELFMVASHSQCRRRPSKMG